ncbi:hypothetical protein [uncultured Williamsia sp.]|uniref:hypothetical protein n=1 Tax=uncultured Williamsia sp. TaxID=259311 RepID=UPI002602E1AD|nr:hypothetical protein [uncultured Williamsia sp.]
MSTSQDWDRAAEVVAAGADELRGAPTHREIRAWAKRENVQTKAMWPKVKTEMRKQLDLDYDELAAATVAAEAARLDAAAADAPLVRLCVAGDAEVSTYAICAAADDRQSWYGTFFDDDRIFDGSDESAERSAADKAVFLAGKVREHLGVPALRLVIESSHPDISADMFTLSGNRHQVQVRVEHVETNPAVALCRAPGYRTWREIPLQKLVEPAEVAS